MKTVCHSDLHLKMSNSDGHLSGHSVPPQDHMLAKSKDLNSTVSCRTLEDNNTCNFLQLPVCKEEVFPEQQAISSNLVQEEPEPPQIKEEQEEEIIQRAEETHGSTSNNLPQDLESKKQTSSIRYIQGKKIHCCTECGKIFLENSHLKIHMRFHTGEKPYTCKVCDKSFTTSSHRTRHMKTHTGEKEFTCITCGEVFGQKGSLTIHMRIHTGEKPLIEYMLAKSLGT